jgi:general stress protein 26
MADTTTPRTLADLAEKMRDIDFCTLSTRTSGGAIAGRPMSNNRDVEYDGDSWFFSYEDARTISDVEADPHVGLAFQGKSGMLGLRPFFLTIEGQASLIRDKGQFEAHWTKDLDRYFPQGIDTPGIVLIKVHASRAHYWDGEDEGEVTL